MNVESTHIEFDDNNILSSLFGVNDSNIRIVEKINKILNSNIENALVNEIKRHDLHRKVTYHKEYKNLNNDDKDEIKRMCSMSKIFDDFIIS